MHGIVRCSFAIIATLYLAAFAGERAMGQVLKGEAAYGGSWGNHGKLVTAAEVGAERANSSRGPAVSSK